MSMRSESNRDDGVGGRRRTLRALVASAVMVALVAPVVPLATPFVEAAGEAGNAAPAAVENRVVVPSAGASITLRGIDTDGDDLAFTLGTTYNVAVDAPSTPLCEPQPNGGVVCTATVMVTPTSSSGSFTYSVTDGAVADSATITVDNGAPRAMPTSVIASPTASPTVTLRGIDPNGDALSFSVSPGSYVTLGAVSSPSCYAQGDGSSVCTATVAVMSMDNGVLGNFSYTVSDGISTSSGAQVDVRNPAPTAMATQLVGGVGSTVTLRGIDPNGDALSFSVSPGSYVTLGAVSSPSCYAQGDGSSVCTATVAVMSMDNGVLGNFSYTVSDGISTSSGAQVDVRNPAPTAMATQLVGGVGSTVTLRGIDPNGDALSFSVSPGSYVTLGAVSSPSCYAQGDGSSVCTATVAVMSMDNGVLGNFSYTVSDGISTSSGAQVDVRNPAPTAMATQLVGGVGSTVTLRGIDPNGDALSFSVSPGSYVTLGAVSSPSCYAQGDGSSVCTATVDVTALSHASLGNFSYTVNDGISTSSSARVDVRNPPPTAVADRVEGVPSPLAVPVTVRLRGIDPNGDALSFSVSPGSYVTLGAVSSPSCYAQGDGSSVCTATVDVTALSHASLGNFSYTVNDGVSSSTATVAVVSSGTPSNATPAAVADRVAIPVAGATVMLRASDADGDALTFEVLTPSSNVTVAPLSTPVCSPQSDGSSLCTVTTSVTPSRVLSTSAFSGSFQYRVNDGLTNSVTVTVNVDNAAPAPVADRTAVPAAGGTVMLRATDANGDALAFDVVSSSNVTVAPLPAPVCSPQGDGASVCTVAATVTLASTSGSFQYRVNDGLTNSSNAILNVSNSAPAAVGDRVVVPAAGGTVMLRATDAEGDALTFSLTSTPSNVTVAPLPAPVCSPQGDGASVCTVAATVTPTGTPGSFQYRVNDGLSNSSNAIVNVINAAPAAVGDRVVVPAAGGTVMLRATDAEGDALTFSLTSTPSNVTVAPLPAPVCSPQGDGASVCTVAATVTPTSTSGSFQYRVNDGHTNSATVSVSVTSPAPHVVVPKVVAGTSGAVVTLGAVDPNGDPLTFQVTGTPSGATVTDPGAVTCNPQADGSVYCYAFVTVVAAQSGWSFSFTASDGLSSASGFVSGSNTTPTAANLAISVPSATSQITLTGTDPDGDDLQFVVGAPYGGDGTVGVVGPVTCNPQLDGSSLCTAQVPFTPGGLDSWTVPFTASDGVSSSGATIWIVRESGADLPPTATYAYVDIVDGSNEITLTGTDPEGADVTFAIDEPPLNGTLSAISTPSCGGGQCTATVTYTPDGLLIDDSFTYVANDGALDSSPATVTLRGDNEPYAYAQWTKITFPTTALTLQGYDYEGSTLSFAVDTAPSSGTVIIEGPPTCDGFYCTQAATYTPDPGHTGADFFTFTVSDAIYTSSPASVNLIGNESPYLVDVQPNRVVGTTTMTVTVAEPDGDPMTIGLGTPPANGSFGELSPLDCVVQPDGSAQCTATVDFTPDPAFEGYDFIEVTIDDGINPPVTRSEVFQIGNRAPTAKPTSS